MKITELVALIVFFSAYAMVILEEKLRVRKSIPMMIAAGIIWVLIATTALPGEAEVAVRANLLEFGELLLFLTAAITYINAMEERQVFGFIRAWLLRRNFSFRSLYWITGLLAFLLSPIADNLTTALVVGTVAIAVGKDNRTFVNLSCINIVVAANAGGAFSPFGDITTLMVWQKGLVPFLKFFRLCIPSLVNWLVPALIMSLAIEKGSPDLLEDEQIKVKPGGGMVVFLFLATVFFTVCMHTFLHLPPALGMMTGLGILKLYSFILRQRSERNPTDLIATEDLSSFDIFKILERIEWDTLMFFYGVILCVGGLGFLGYLSTLSHLLYGSLGVTGANVSIGVLSAVLDNIPMMYAVLSMNPEMTQSQWLLVTLTAGVGGSLLSIGSAAGVALMGHARGNYTFSSHLRWTWAILFGYVASIITHVALNG